MEDIRAKDRSEDLSTKEDKKREDESQDQNKLTSDGGWRWVVCLGALTVNFLTVGQQNSAGVLYSALLSEYSTQRGETAWVFSLASSMMYLFAAVGTSLAERYGSRIVVIAGSFVSASGLIASSFTTTLPPLYATYGVIWGLGASLGLFPSFVILTKYFKRRLALASGIALSGAAIGSLAYGPLVEALYSKYGIAVTFRTLAGFQSLMFFSALTFRPVEKEIAQIECQRKCDCGIFSNRGYVIWVAALSTFMLVFLVPFVHLVRFAEDRGVNKTQASLLTGYLAIGVLVGSLVFGFVCDLPRFNRLKVCQLTLLSMAISCCIVTLATKYEWICVYAFAFGVLDGGYEMLVPVITRDLVGPRKVARAIGALYCIMAFPKTLGPPIAGSLFDASKDYSLSFYFTGAVTILSTAIMFFLNWVPLVKDCEEAVEIVMPSSDSDVTPLNKDDRDAQRQSLILVTADGLQAQSHGSKIWSPYYFVKNNGEYEYLEKVTAV